MSMFSLSKEGFTVFLVAILGVLLVGGIGVIGAAEEGSIALMTDVGGQGDLSFNDMAVKGLKEAAEDFDLETKIIEPASTSDYMPNLRTLSRTGKYDLIIAVGALLGDSVNKAAKQFPDQKFALIDTAVDQPNVLNILFREQESSALLGALGAMVAAHYDYSNVGAVFGIELPVLWRFEGGFRYGINWGLNFYGMVTGEIPEVGFLYNYTGSFTDVAKGRSAAKAQLSQDAGVVFNVAGALGLGIAEAVSEEIESKGKETGPPFMFGADASQDYLKGGNTVLASAMKKVDLASYRAIKRVVNDNFEGGTMELGLAENGVGISRFSDLVSFISFAVDSESSEVKEGDAKKIEENWLKMREELPQFIWDGVNELENKIVAGEVTPPKAETKEEIEEIRKEYP